MVALLTWSPELDLPPSIRFPFLRFVLVSWRWAKSRQGMVTPATEKSMVVEGDLF